MKLPHLLFLIAACSSGDDDDTPMDGGFPDAFFDADGGTREEVEIGTGVDGFESVTEGQLVPIILGPQGGGRWGGFHLWHAARTRAFVPSGAIVRFKTFLASTREVLAMQERRIDLQRSGEWHQVYGIAPQLQDCCLAEEQDVIMFIEVEDSTGKIGRDEVRVRATVCREANGLSVCP